jgi:hypothetical protein
LGQGRYRLWAAAASVLFHAVVLSVLAATRLGTESVQPASGRSDEARLTWVKNITQSCPVVARPDVKWFSSADFVRWRADFGKLNRVKLPDKAEVPTSGLHIDGPESTLPVSSSYADLAWSQKGPAPREVEFFSSTIRCRGICYLVDCSGSMKGLLGHVKDELSRSIAALQPDQYFGIIFFGNDRVMEFKQGKLVRASRDARTEALMFVKSVDAAGPTNALAGFAGAVKMRDDGGAGPEAILFLTDGFELSAGDAYKFRQKVIELRDRYLAGCSINTIGFWPSQSDRRLLESIACVSGGRFVCIGGEGF